MTYVDIMDIKANIDSGRLAVKLNMFNNLLLEDTQTCEAIRLMQLPEGYSFHEKGKWHPAYVYTSNSVAQPMHGEEGWECSVCGWTTTEKYDWCTCGADMRESRKFKNV
jgi:hypothetical protein